MKSFYKVIDSIQTVVSAEPFNNTVTFGDISEIDLKKQSLFPCLLYTSDAADEE